MNFIEIALNQKNKRNLGFLDIKLGQFTQEELGSVLRKIINSKAAGLDEILPEVWKPREFDDILLRRCNAVYTQNTRDRWTKGCNLLFLRRVTSEEPRTIEV